MIKITKTGEWGQANPAKPNLTLVTGEDAAKYPESEVELMIKHGWAAEEKSEGGYFIAHKGGGYFYVLFGDPEQSDIAERCKRDGKEVFRKEKALEFANELKEKA